jgi:2-C-methyl-D-erythritol 4-phosphate cytidylyltransferase
MSVWAVVVAAGEGRRFGGPKQLAHLGGRRVLDWAVDAACAIAAGVIVVTPPRGLPQVSEGEKGTRGILTVPGGATRAASVRAGLAAVPDAADIVVVHDAARPLASPALFRAVVSAVEGGADGAVPGVPVGDTLKRVDQGAVVATVDRADLVMVQTPQAFRAGILRAAHEGDPEATDDAALVEAVGGTVVVVPGEHRNLKVTVAEDLMLARALHGG